MPIAQNSQPVLLSIAGSDPSAGAGIQADIKTAAALQVYAVTAISALTVQNSRGVHSVQPVAESLLRDQIQALVDDHHIACVKVGMLASVVQVALLCDLVSHSVLSRVPWVLDTPLVASSGQALYTGENLTRYRELIAKATLITPNLDEAARLTGCTPAQDDTQMLAQTALLHAQGVQTVLLKGGHRPDEAADLLWRAGAEPLWFRAPFIRTRNSHGTGCTLASAIAAFLVRGLPLADAVQQAIEFQRACLAHSIPYAVGDVQSGIGSLWHFAAPLLPSEENNEQHD